MEDVKFGVLFFQFLKTYGIFSYFIDYHKYERYTLELASKPLVTQKHLTIICPVCNEVISPTLYLLEFFFF